jgi:Concanavalin A-like lectin/glucanases superfamily
VLCFGIVYLINSFFIMHVKTLSLTRSQMQTVALALGFAVLAFGTVVGAAIISGAFTTASSTQVTTTVLTLAKPQSLEGSLLLAHVAINGGNSAIVSSPAGWTLIARTDNDTNVALLSYWKTVMADEPVSYTWTVQGQTTAKGGIIAYSGVNNTHPIDVVASSTGFSNTAIAPAITTTGTNEQVVALFATDEGKAASASAYFSTPSGMTEKYDVTNIPFGPSIAADEITQPSPGIANAKSASLPGGKSRNWSAQHIALRSLPPVPQPVAYWKLDGNSNDAVGVNHGSDMNIAYSVANGKINEGAAFDGETSGISLNPLLCGPVNLSASAWVKSTSSTTPSQWIVGQRNSGAMNGQWRLQLDNNGRASFYSEGGGNGTPDYIHGNTSVNDGNWHNIGVSQNGNTYTFYVDGVADGMATLGTAVSYDCNLLGSIGFNRFQDVHEQFAGFLDEIGVWNVELSANDFSQIYDAGTGKQYPF